MGRGYTDRNQSGTNVPVCVDAAKLKALFVGELFRKCFATATDEVNFSCDGTDGQEILEGPSRVARTRLMASALRSS